MHVRVEGLAHLSGHVEAVVLERVEDQLAGHAHAGEQAFAGFVVAAVLDGEIKAVQRGEEVLEDRLAGVAHVFVMVALEAFFEILHLREGAQAGVVRFRLDRAGGTDRLAALFLKRFFRGFGRLRRGFLGLGAFHFGLGITCIGHSGSLQANSAPALWRRAQ